MSRSVEKVILGKLVGKYRNSILLIIMSSVFGYLLSIITPLSFMAIIDRVLVSQGYATLNIILVILVFVAISQFLINLISSKLSVWVNSAHISEIISEFFVKLFSLKKIEFERLSVGETISRLGELDKVKGYISDWITKLSLDVIFMMIFFFIIYNLNEKLALVLLATVPAHLVQYFIFNKKIKTTQNEMFLASIDYQNRVIESVSAFDSLRSSRKGNCILNRIYDAFNTKLKKGYDLAVINIWSTQMSTFVNNISEALILFAGATLVLDQQMTLGALVAFNMMKSRVTDPLLRLASIWEEIIAFKISLERVNVIMKAESEISNDSLHQIVPLENNICLNCISFSYQHNKKVLNNVSFSIDVNRTLCILGESGAGKSTLSKLISGEYDHYSGEILFDNLELRRISLPCLREQIAIVQQHSILLAGTIAENILFDSCINDTDWMEKAAKMADIHNFICSLPDGYNTYISEQGSNLSGGQKQRIALARALASDKPILILDEATSALDYETEANIVNNLEKYKKDKTVIIITHRLSLARISDFIIYMQNGEVIEQGTHNELLSKDSYYKNLYKYQLGDLSLLFPKEFEL